MPNWPPHSPGHLSGRVTCPRLCFHPGFPERKQAEWSRPLPELPRSHPFPPCSGRPLSLREEGTWEREMRSRWKCPDVSLRMASSRVFLNSGGHTKAHLVARWTELPTADSQQWALAKEGPGTPELEETGGAHGSPGTHIGKSWEGCERQADLAPLARLGPNHAQEVSSALASFNHLSCVQTAGTVGSWIKAPHAGCGRGVR